MFAVIIGINTNTVKLISAVVSTFPEEVFGAKSPYPRVVAVTTDQYNESRMPACSATETTNG